ncbi:MAG: GTPase RsgA, partial [Acidimicrobiales bacterium]
MRPPADHPLAPYGWTAEVAARYEAPVRAAFAAGRAEPGRVVRVERGFDTVRVAGGELLVARAHPEFRAAGLRGAAGPVVGDWAAVSLGPEPAVVALAPRRGCLSRRDPRARAVEQPVAANVDVVVIAAPLDRAFNPRRLERALVLVHEAGADPLVALTKSDLADPTAVEDALAAAEALAAEGIEA